MSILDDLDEPSEADLASIEADDDFWNSLVDDDGEDYEPQSDDDREVDLDDDGYESDLWDSYK